MKVCVACGIEKINSEFAIKSGIRRYSKCQDCQLKILKEKSERIAAKAREYVPDSPEKIAAYRREYYKANAEKLADRAREYNRENAGRITERAREYRKANAERIADWMREYQKNNAEKIAARVSKYNKLHPEKQAAITRNYRARKRSAVGTHTAVDIARILDKQKGLCANCHTKLFEYGKHKYHVDHIMPLARGGSNWPSNLQCLCPTCNLSKNAKDPIEWAQQNGRLL